jgi:hypothetical protein
MTERDYLQLNVDGFRIERREITLRVGGDEADGLEAVSSNSSRVLDLYNCSNTPAVSRLLRAIVNFESSNQASKKSKTKFILF